MSSSSKTIAHKEKATLDSLRTAIRELPLAELAKLRQNGLNGQPLHRALGFTSEKDVTKWLMTSSNNEDESSSEGTDEEQEEERAKRKSNTVKRASRESSTSDESEDESSEDDEVAAPPVKKTRKVSAEDDPWLLAAEEKEERGGTKMKNQKHGRESRADDSSSDEEGEDDDGTSGESSDEGDGDKPKSKSKKKRSKKAPAERPSNVQVSRRREVVPVPKYRYKSLDPRFSHQELDVNVHRHRYAFLEEHRDQEIDELRTQVKRELLAREIKGRKGRRLRKMTDEELAERRADLTRLEQHKADSRRAKMYQERLSEVKKRNAELVKKGIVEKPRIISQKDKKQLQMEVRFEELQKRNKLDKFMDKKRKEREDKVHKEDRKGPKLGI